MSLVKSYEGGRESHARVIVHSLFEEYLSVEELFSDNIQVRSYCVIVMVNFVLPLQFSPHSCCQQVYLSCLDVSS